MCLWEMARIYAAQFSFPIYDKETFRNSVFKSESLSRSSNILDYAFSRPNSLFRPLSFILRSILTSAFSSFVFQADFLVFIFVLFDNIENDKSILGGETAVVGELP